MTEDEKPKVCICHFDDRNNVLYDLQRGIVIRLTLEGIDLKDETKKRLYSIAELTTGVEKRLIDLHESTRKAKDNAEVVAENDPDLVLSSFVGFIVAPGISAVVTGFHRSFLLGLFIGRLIKNRKITVVAKRDNMTAEERQYAEEQIREQGAEPFDPKKSGS